MATTPRQLIDQATRHSVYLEKLKSYNVKEYEKLLKKMEAIVRSELLGSEISEWKLSRLNVQIKAIVSALEDVHSDVKTIWNRQLMELAEYETEFELRSLGAVSKYSFNLPSATQVWSAVSGSPLQATGPYQGILLEGFFDGWSVVALRQLEGAIRLGYAQGQTTASIVRGIIDAGGAMDMTRRNLTSVVRTSLQHAASVARQATWAANSDIVTGVRIVATLDSRTSLTCRSLDGKVFPVDKGPRPPFHINCRTTTAAALDSRFSMLDEGGTRSARTDEGVEDVPANETYYGWLKRQPREFQDDVLGQARAKLFRDGGLSSERFAELQLGKNFSPMTLEQMREREPLAFKRAGL